MNLMLLGLIALMWATVGLKTFLLVQVPITVVSGAVGVYVFYVQHQYGDAYWSYREDWDYYTAALKGSAYLVLPKVLQWFSGNIGIHHIHHMNARIPNYRLQQCLDENPELQDARRLSLAESFTTFRLALWDEDERQLIGFREIPAVRERIEAEAKTPIRATKPAAVPRVWR